LKLALLALAAAAVPLAEGPFQDLTFAQALERAKEQNKVVFVDFFTTWCGPCKALDKTTWKDQRVIGWLGEKTVALKVDAEASAQLATDYRINAYPTLLFVRPDGSQVGRIVGYRNAEDFLADAADLLAGKPPRSPAVKSGDPAKDVEAARKALEGHEHDAKLRSALAGALVEAGLYPDALEHYLWLWDESLQYNSSYLGVRASFLLGDIRRLMNQYEPAKQAMEQRRQALETSLREGQLTKQAAWAAASDLDSLNESLFAEPERTLALYDELRAQRGDEDLQVQNLRSNVIEALVGKRRYEEALLGKVDFVGRFKLGLEAERRFRESSKIPAELAALIDPEEEALATIERSMPHFEAYAGTGRVAEARAMAQLAIEFAPREATFLKLLQRAQRAEAPDLGRELLDQAKKSLEGESLAKVEKAGAWVH